MNTEYRTSSLNLAAVLLTLGYTIVEITHQPETPRRKIFVFTQDEKLEEIVNQYFNNELLVNPFRLLNELKMLKARVYDQNQAQA